MGEEKIEMKDIKKGFEVAKNGNEMHQNLLKQEEKIKKEIEKLKKSNIDFYEKVRLIYFREKDFDFFVNRLNELYNKNFKLVSIKTQHTENFVITHRYIGDLEDYDYEDNYKTYCLKILVDEKIFDFVANKIKKSSVENIKKLYNKENIVLIDQGWCSDEWKWADHDYTSLYKLSSYNNAKPILDLEKVFNHLSERNIFRNGKENNNPYYKNDERFLTAVFDTIKFSLKNKKQKEKEEKDALSK